MTTIRVDTSEGIALVTMDNPPVNSQPMDFISGLTDAFDAITDRSNVRVAVLTGAGKMFSAGADLKDRPNLDARGRAGSAIARCAKSATRSSIATNR
jgi:enoyl-CoA hydratase